MTTIHTLIICPASTAQQAREAAKAKTGRSTFGAGIPGVATDGGPVEVYAWDLPVRKRYWEALVAKAEQLGADIYLREQRDDLGYPFADSIDGGLAQSGYQRQQTKGAQ